MNAEDLDADSTTAHLTTGLVWGIKASFLNYLYAMPDSQSSVARGAGVTSAGEYYFPIAGDEEYDRESGLGRIKLDGDVRFAAHHGMLFMIFAHPWVSFSADSTTLSIADPDSYPEFDRRLPLLDLTPTAAVDQQSIRAWSPMASTLRPEAVAFFNDVYPAGEPFAPVELRIRLMAT